jgi:hypothetical protein
MTRAFSALPVLTHSPVISAPIQAARVALGGITALLAASLTGCYVVPIDSRTGQAWPPHSPAHSSQAAPSAPSASSLPGMPYTPAPPPGPTPLQGRLYPVNDTATQAGVLTAQVNDNHSGRGSISLNYKGQTLQGEATRVDAGYASFGRVHEEVFGASRREFTGRRGVANAYGNGGVGARCEYVITGPTLGTGACVFSDGAKYQLHFGS